jgi:excinuclease ABC subunit A
MPPTDIQFSEHLACPEHGSVITEIEPRTFSFNTPHGACPTCQGLGSRQEIDPDLLIPDRSVALINGAIADDSWDGPKDNGGYYWQMLEAVAEHYQIDLEAPVATIPDEKLNKILYGTGGKELNVSFTGRNGRKSTFRASFEGVINNLERRYRETNSEYVRGKISEFMSDRPCPTCGGNRLRPEVLAVTIDGINIVEVTSWPVRRALEWIERLSANPRLSATANADRGTHPQRDRSPAWVSWSTLGWTT